MHIINISNKDMSRIYILVLFHGFFYLDKRLVACWCLIKAPTDMVSTLKAKLLFVLMHCGILNGYHLLCNAYTVLEQ